MKRTVATKLDPTEHAALEQMARENDRSISAELRRALKFYLEAARDAAGAVSKSQVLRP